MEEGALERYYFRIKAQNNTTALVFETEEGVYETHEGPGNRYFPRIYKKRTPCQTIERQNYR